MAYISATKNYAFSELEFSSSCSCNIPGSQMEETPPPKKNFLMSHQGSWQVSKISSCSHSQTHSQISVIKPDCRQMPGNMRDGKYTIYKVCCWCRQQLSKCLLRFSNTDGEERAPLVTLSPVFTPNVGLSLAQTDVQLVHNTTLTSDSPSGGSRPVDGIPDWEKWTGAFRGGLCRRAVAENRNLWNVAAVYICWFPHSGTVWCPLAPTVS